MESRSKSSMMFWKKSKKEGSDRAFTSATQLGQPDMSPTEFEGKDVGLFSLFVPFVKNYAASMSKTKNPAKLPYPTCFYLPQSSLMHMVSLQMNHVDLLLDASLQVTPVERFLGLVKYSISTWSLTKFPYKPIISLLGETAQYSSPYQRSPDPEDRTYVLGENLRKDPPCACVYITNPKHGVAYEATIDLQPKFKQAHVQVSFKGQNKITFCHPEGLYREEYYTNIPDFVIRLLRMHQELTGEVTFTSSTGFSCTIVFKEKTLFGKAKNLVVGSVSYNGAMLYTLDGAWDEIVYLTDIASGQRGELLNRSAITRNPIESPPLEMQPPTSGDRLWGEMLEALRRQDFDSAATMKAQINADEGLLIDSTTGTKDAYIPRYFKQMDSNNGLWEIKDPALALSLGDPMASAFGPQL